MWSLYLPFRYLLLSKYLSIRNDEIVEKCFKHPKMKYYGITHKKISSCPCINGRIKQQNKKKFETNLFSFVSFFFSFHGNLDMQKKKM